MVSDMKLTLVSVVNVCLNLCCFVGEPDIYLGPLQECMLVYRTYKVTYKLH